MARILVIYLPLRWKMAVLTVCAVRIYRLVLNIENGVSATEPVELATIRLADGTVDDIKFVDDETLMLSISKDCWCSKSINTEQFLQLILVICSFFPTAEYSLQEDV